MYVDPGGRAVYVAEEERSGEVLCVDACLGIWDPVTASASDAAGDSAPPSEWESSNPPDTGGYY